MREDLTISETLSIMLLNSNMMSNGYKFELLSVAFELENYRVFYGTYGGDEPDYYLLINNTNQSKMRYYGVFDSLDGLMMELSDLVQQVCLANDFKYKVIQCTEGCN